MPDDLLAAVRRLEQIIVSLRLAHQKERLKVQQLERRISNVAWAAVVAIAIMLMVVFSSVIVFSLTIGAP